MKINMTTLAVLVLGFIVLSGGSFASMKVDFGDWFGGGDNLVKVNKKLTLSLTDVYAGSKLASKTLYLYVGTTLKETLTTGSDGTVNTAFPYESDTSISVYYEDSNTKQWFHQTVPRMNPADAESVTYNSIGLEAFTVCTGTDALRVGATSISDAGNYNFTASGVTPQFTYDFFVTSDNTGFISSQDPIYSMGYYAVVYMKLSGTNYETVLVYDFDSDYVLGTTHWCAKRISDDSITKYKVGTTYIHDGEMHFQYSLDGTGYSGTGTTMQLYLKIYSDPAYHESHGGSYGPEVVELSEHTVTLQS